MKKNLSLLDAFIRIALGLFLLGKGVSHRCNGLMLFGALETASGATRFCPIYKLFHLSTGGCCHHHQAPLKPVAE